MKCDTEYSTYLSNLESKKTTMCKSCSTRKAHADGKIDNKAKLMKKVELFNLENNLLRTFNSLSECANFVNRHNSPNR